MTTPADAAGGEHDGGALATGGRSPIADAILGNTPRTADANAYAPSAWFADEADEADGGLARRAKGPLARRRRGLDQHRRADRFEGAARQVRDPRLLDLLLHQLHAHFAGAQKLEKEYPNELVVIGVHSAKFETEQDTKNITEAVLRYEIEHPVINDPEHRLWEKYGVSSWPSLRMIDPEGYVSRRTAAKSTSTRCKLFKKRSPLTANRPARRNAAAFRPRGRRTADTPLRFPGKVLADEAGERLFIADSNHNRIVIAGSTARCSK